MTLKPTVDGAIPMVWLKNLTPGQLFVYRGRRYQCTGAGGGRPGPDGLHLSYVVCLDVDSGEPIDIDKYANVRPLTPSDLAPLPDAAIREAANEAKAIIAQYRDKGWNPPATLARLSWLLGLTPAERAFVSHLAGRPDDTDTWKVYHDWLIDQGREAHAEEMDR